MATAPAYAVTPRMMCGLVPATADTSFTSPSSQTTLGSAGSNGTKVTQVDVLPAGTVVAGVVNIFLYDGSAYHLWDSVAIPAATVSTTAAPAKITRTYASLVLPSGWSLRVTNTVSGNVSLIEVNASGADL